jgi:hypothetical protein
MAAIRQWFWEGYLLVYGCITIIHTYNFFVPTRPQHIHMHLMLAFDPVMVYVYSLELLNILCQWLLLIPIVLYVYKIRLFPQWVWKGLLMFRYNFHIMVTVEGLSYHYLTIIAMYHFNTQTAMMGLLAFYGIHLPAYYAAFHYAVSEDYGITPKTPASPRRL